MLAVVVGAGLGSKQLPRSRIRKQKLQAGKAWARQMLLKAKEHNLMVKRVNLAGAGEAGQGSKQLLISRMRKLKLLQRIRPVHQISVEANEGNLIVLAELW